MSYLHERRGAVGWLTLDRPAAMNSLSRELMRGLHAQLDQWRDDPAVRVVVLSGNGRAFCAGADLKEVSAPVAAGEPDFIDVARAFFATLRGFPKPVIAAVNGLAVAGGLELVLACDLVVAAESARLGDAHANFGVFPGAGGAAVLPRKLPANVARLLLFTGRTLSAAQMERHGLVNEVVADGGLASHAQALAEELATRSPLVLARMKRVAAAAADKAQADALRHELLEFRDHQRSHDMQEGLRAFAEKRAPVFKGC
ncbi:Short chain enoyl-CoA hydratase [Cupriavidus taiwanensis]|uniref:Short chain enoyl-CoA hydratase n=1 Tax=Cupriavidus taiwanensis TaxID=164546 RepID=A0A375E6C8_9BURK|nr:enoyl-CoA hydratase/isomerase family protein [Cupriavidus taiwanensis]SOZ64488.1 Short chain enoyl-CoA hydratase [Cupriavidus taiwanensis]SOZ65196.1 Short chain enoyl-CoA hydratase [Cupriavidus taiwanensis]SOZ68835.1 Short chain enoyl-CoA hydratase [Cupriavidus taiwanensis]SPA08273.1 Short chain enoyl-CoA hydratase [Cupriavidus taiwanensis]